MLNVNLLTSNDLEGLNVYRRSFEVIQRTGNYESHECLPYLSRK